MSLKLKHSRPQESEAPFPSRGKLLTILTVGDQESSFVVAHSLDGIFQGPLVGTFAYPAL